MTAAEFSAKWFDDPENFKIFTGRTLDLDAPGNKYIDPSKTPMPFPAAGLPPGVEVCKRLLVPPGGTYVDAARDLASLSPEDRATVSAKFPPLIWNNLPAVKEA